MNLISNLSDIVGLLVQSLAVVPLLGSVGLLCAMALGSIRRRAPLKSQHFAADHVTSGVRKRLRYSAASESVFDPVGIAANAPCTAGTDKATRGIDNRVAA